MLNPVTVLGVVIILSIFAFSYLQAYHGYFLQNQTTPEEPKAINRLKSKESRINKALFPLRWFYAHYIYSRFRSPFTRPELSLTIFSLTPVAVVFVYGNQNGLSIDPFVIATLFYASVLFFKEVFLADYPFVRLDPSIVVKDEGLIVSYTVSNIGSKAVSMLSHSYSVYDGNGRLLKGPSPPNILPARDPVSLEPGETSREFTVSLDKFEGFDSLFGEVNKIDEETPTPIFIEIRTSTGIGHRFLGDRDMLRFDPESDTK